MTQYNQVSGVYVLDLPFKNTSGSDIAAGYAVIADSSNPPSPSTPGGITLPASDATPLGVTVDAIPNGKIGRVRLNGVAPCVCSAAITYGGYVMADSAGKVTPQTSTNYAIGVALGETGATGEIVAVLLDRSVNA